MYIKLFIMYHIKKQGTRLLNQFVNISTSFIIYFDNPLIFVIMGHGPFMGAWLSLYEDIEHERNRDYKRLKGRGS